MRKTERLDQILIRLGYATPAQIQAAVERQQREGGRFGNSLIELGYVTEEQLFDALVEQFRVPTIQVNENTVPRELLRRMPKDALTKSLVVPVAWNDEQKVLSLAVANPSDEETITKVGQAFGAKKVRVSMAPESVLTDLAIRLGESDGGEDVRLVALPELFEPESAEKELAVPPADERSEAIVLLVTSSAAKKNFLPPVFKPEGLGVLAVSNVEEARDALTGLDVDRVLVDEPMEPLLRAWIADGRVPDPEARISVFSSVSEALLENPLPYRSVAQSLRASVQAMAELRCAQHGVSPPYGLMANDLEALADRLHLPRLVADALNIGLHVLLPVEAGRSIDPFHAFSASLELVARLRFGWPIDAMLGTCQGLFVGRLELAQLDEPKGDVAVAAQLLALVWFRHNLLETEAESGEDAMTEVRTRLRELAGRFASLELIEAYLDEISERGGVDTAAAGRAVLLVGGERITRALSPALTRVGSPAIVSQSIAEAQTTAEEQQPAAIVIDHEVFGAEVERFGRVVKLGATTLLFAITDAEDPALVLNLLDIGVDDVFGPPHDFDLIAARISRAMRSRSTLAPAGPTEPGQFSATFEAFSFLDLAQMLSNGMKSVRVDLSRGETDKAVMYLVNGAPVYAACGELRGAAAVYEVITWEQEGEFTVREDTGFPEQNIQESTESLLMEGVRLLDESRAGAG